MRHSKAGRRLSRPTEHRDSVLANLAKGLVQHGRIRTTVAKAKEAQRMADRLISLGKEGSVHARRQAYRVLEHRELVKRLFADISPLFLESHGGYTRIIKLSPRHGDGAELALLELTKFPAPEPVSKPKTKDAAQPAKPEASGKQEPSDEEEGGKPKGFFEGLRGLFGTKIRPS